MKWLIGLLILLGLGAAFFLLRGNALVAVFPRERTQNPNQLPSSPAPEPDNRPAVFLTFDGGGNNGGAAKIREVLEREKIPATFFLTGRFMERYPDDARALAKLGPIGNHTYSHPHLPQLSFASATEEILKVGTIAERLDIALKPYFRFPYGESTPELDEFIKTQGLNAFGWTVDTAGWRGISAGETIENIRERVKKKLTPDAIILMHLGSNPQDKSTLDADALLFLIADIRAADYVFKSL